MLGLLEPEAKGGMCAPGLSGGNSSIIIFKPPLLISLFFLNQENHCVSRFLSIN
jgi:hypothetical protein